ncbi:MAG: sugar transferase [Verrucomicrobiota bacterium]
MITAVKAKYPKRKSSSLPGTKYSTEGNSQSHSDGQRLPASLKATSASLSESVDPRKTVSDSVVNPHQTRGWKRGLDLSCIAISLPLVLPLMAMIVLWIRLVSRGPALFRQERIGQNGKRFVLYKFRSMKMNAGTSRHETYLRHLVKSDSPMIKLDLLCDSRLIPGGCLLRAAGLDELPQLLNVLMGEMSLVGPRPCLPQEYAYFSSQQRERFKALPGLTGSWQVSGKNQSTFSEMNEMDIQYVRHATLGLDLGIMMRTPSVLIHQMSQAAHQKLAAHQGSRNSQHETSPKCGTQRIG